MYDKPIATLADGTSVHTYAELMTAVRPALRRTVLQMNKKGGQGKTPVTTNVPARLAATKSLRAKGRRFLIVDGDPQGNATAELGVYDGDDGASLLEALTTGAAPTVIRDVRPGLDIVAGGKQLDFAVARYMNNLTERREAYAQSRLAVALSQLAHEYDMIFIDSPPTGLELHRLYATAASFILVPANWDQFGQDGLEGVSDRMDDVRELNPGIDVLGVVLFGFDSIKGAAAAKGEGGQRARARQSLEALIAESNRPHIPVFSTVIATATGIGEIVRKRGELSHELAEYAREDAKTMTLDVGDGQKVTVTCVALNANIEEFGSLAKEIYTRMNAVAPLAVA